MLGQNNLQNYCLPNQYPQQQYPPPQQYQQPVQGIPVSIPIHSIPDTQSNKKCYEQCCRIAGITGIVLSIIIIISLIIAFITTDCDDSENSDSSICKSYDGDEDYTNGVMYG